MTTPDPGHPSPAAEPMPEPAQTPAEPVAPPPAPYAFTPVVREPWINPRRRRPAGLVAAGAAIVLLGAGVGIGAAAFGGDGHHGDRTGRPFNRGGNLQPGFPRGGPGYGRGPGGQRIVPPAPQGPTSVPNAPATTSHS